MDMGVGAACEVQGETDLDNVLQMHEVYVNVSKGQLAKTEELTKAFATEDRDKIILEILKKGQLQIGDKERSQQLETLYRDIATTVAEKCVNPETNRPYTVTMVEKAMGDLHFSVNPNKGAKQQALEVIKQLEEKKVIPIARAMMRLRIVMATKDGKRLKEKMLTDMVTIEDEDWGDEYEVTCSVDPGKFRAISEAIQTETKGRGQIEVLGVSNVEDLAL
ncbi:SBDS protein C-terminal domain-containing protein [Blyttiomyces helicus]|uniref:SBDS protein C-terminal domain-containing protein n=1 Tax=Blyttiomyces helicus TaxID=388810 RepID=A0A4P9VUW0_9FUNG|nr:SBDS protein C-terminal domain-containing protein [Blyttiomyces helicus]|eukprot:RKO83399.1 SBDS protein C-terminal domain-containing protein [Blyttiomyces helicus]